jgi:nitronate monooxygenase
MSLPASIRERLRMPAMVAPMFLVSGVDLVIASCKAGLIGTLTRNHCRSDEEFEKQLFTVRDALVSAREQQADLIIGPLAANVSIGMDPAARTRALQACRRYGVDIIVTAGGDPKAVAAEVHEGGGRIFHDVTSLRFAEKAITAGVDGVVAIGSGGGGHSGALSHLVLVPQIRSMFDGTIVMAGAVACGAAIRAAEVLGADLAYLGTRFIASRESMVPDAYKVMLTTQQADDVVYTDAVNGLPAMWLQASLRDAGLDPNQLPRGGRRGSAHLPTGVKPWVNLWSAGQGIGLIHDIPTVSDLVERLHDEYRQACMIPAWRDTAGDAP